MRLAWVVWFVCSITMLSCGIARGDEPAPQPTAEQLRVQVAELEAVVEDLKTQVRLRSGELIVAKGRLRALERRAAAKR